MGKREKWSELEIGEENQLRLNEWSKGNEIPALSKHHTRVWVRRGGFIGSWGGNRRERYHWGDLGVDGWIILGWISRRWDVGIWTGLG